MTSSPSSSKRESTKIEVRKKTRRFLVSFRTSLFALRTFPLARLAQVRQLLLDRGVVARLHAKARRAAGEVAQLAGVAEQLGERDVGVQHAPALVQAGVEDLAAPPADVAGQVAQVVA